MGFFLEEKALNADGQLNVPVDVAINKIGHAMHDLDPVFREWSRSAKVAELMSDLGYQQPIPVQSMYIFKVRRNARTMLERLCLAQITLLTCRPSSYAATWHWRGGEKYSCISEIT